MNIQEIFRKLSKNKKQYKIIIDDLNHDAFKEI